MAEKDRRQGIKLLISGYENSGKSTISSKIEDAIIINMDNKEYGFRVVHANFKEYTGVQSAIDFIAEKIKRYKEVKGKYPNTLVLDTVTQMYTNMQRFNGSRYKGFDVHTRNNLDTIDFNNFIETSVLASGINVVIVAHVEWDVETSRYVIPSSGQFKKAGSWLSVVNNAIFVEKSNSKITVHLHGLKFPCRTTLTDYPESMDSKDFDINKLIHSLENTKIESLDMCLD